MPDEQIERLRREVNAGPPDVEGFTRLLHYERHRGNHPVLSAFSKRSRVFDGFSLPGVIIHYQEHLPTGVSLPGLDIVLKEDHQHKELIGLTKSYIKKIELLRYWTTQELFKAIVTSTLCEYELSSIAPELRSKTIVFHLPRWEGVGEGAPRVNYLNDLRALRAMRFGYKTFVDYSREDQLRSYLERILQGEVIEQAPLGSTLNTRGRELTLENGR